MYDKSGVVIEHGAVIGMGSIVMKSVGPYEIWGGNPAKLIKKRFSEDIIEELIKTEWWNLNESILSKKAKDFNNIDDFLNIYMKGK